MQLPGFVVGFSADGSVTLLSAEARDFFGGGEDLQGLSLTQLIHPDCADEMAELMLSLERKSGSGVSATLRLLGANDVYSEFEGTLASGLEGVPDADFVFNGLDVTIHKRLSQQYLDLLEASVQPVLVHRKLRPLFCNSALVELMGAPSHADLLAANSVLDYVHAEDLALASAVARARMRGEAAPSKYRLRLAAPSGGPVWVESRATPIHWEGEPATLLTLTNIQERVRAEQAQRRSEQLFERVFQTSPSVLSLVDADSDCFIDVNDAFLSTFAYERDEIIGHHVDEFRLWVQPETVRAVMRKVKAGQPLSGMELQGIVRSGEIRDFMVSAELIAFEGRRILLLSRHDVSASKRQQQEIIASKEAADIANRAKSEFLANMSHELRTPLNAILGFSEIIKDELHGSLGDPRYREYAQDIHASGSHLLSIINDILDLSKVEAGKLEVNECHMDFSEVLASCRRLIAPRARDAGIALVMTCPEALPYILADERLIRQILLNLLTNAVKFTSEGGLVQVGAAVTADGGFAFWVEDNGIGMDEAGVKIALQSFGQVDSSFSRKQEGSGLGLPLVAAFVERQGGRLHIDSALGRGTKVTVSFPPERVQPR